MTGYQTRQLWNPLTGGGPVPLWTGDGFMVGGEKVSVLRYHDAESGWSDGLTNMHEEIIGADHYIDRASRRQAIRSLRPVLSMANPAILEVGCSSGYLLEDLRASAGHAFLVGSDFIGDVLSALARRVRGVPLVQFDITKCPLPSESFDAVVMLNVLEHIDDDALALKQVHRILKPGGMAVVEVPAGPHLFDHYDEQLMHHRRYSLQDLREKALMVGFRIERESHLGFFLYPFFAATKRWNRRKLGRMTYERRRELVSKQIGRVSANSAMQAVMRMELALGRYVSYPIGIRCLMSLSKHPARH